MRKPLIATALAATLLLAGCGSSSSSSSASSAGSASSTSSAASCSANTTANANINGGKPTIKVPTTPAPTTLQSTDLVVGSGAVAKTGDCVTVQYDGVNYADGKQFDASWDDGQPFAFTLGAGQVIKGWDQGVAGMKVGGRRQLIIPPSLGYGDQANGPIVANETLVFVVDLVAVN